MASKLYSSLRYYVVPRSSRLLHRLSGLLWEVALDIHYILGCNVRLNVLAVAGCNGELCCLVL